MVQIITSGLNAQPKMGGSLMLNSTLINLKNAREGSKSSVIDRMKKEKSKGKTSIKKGGSLKFLNSKRTLVN